MYNIYLDNSATTCVSKEAAAQALDVMTNHYGNPSSLHGKGSEAYSALGIARNQIAQLLACTTTHVYFTSGGTEANNLAVIGSSLHNGKKGSKIVTTAIEHHSILESFEYLESLGFKIEYVKPNPISHRIEAADFINAVDENTVFASFMYVNNETGEILPAKEIIEGIKAKSPNTLIHIDCVQAFGKIPVRTFELDADFISASSHKIHGPKGAGFLYAKNKDIVIPRAYGGKQESKLRPGTEALPAVAAFGKAAQTAMYQMDDNYKHVSLLRDRLAENVSKLPNAHINSFSDSLPYVFNFSIPGFNSDKLVSYFSTQGIYFSASSACSKGAKSHVLAAMGYDNELINSCLRIGLSKFNTVEEIDVFLNELKKYIKKQLS